MILPLFLLTLLFNFEAFACPLRELDQNNVSLADLSQHKEIVTKDGKTIAFKPPLSNYLKSYISPSLADCRELQSFEMLYRDSVYSVIYTNNDFCDGGNSMGLIFLGTEMKPENIVGMINDSFIECYGSEK